MGGEDRELARLLQELGANALGPVVTRMVGGWRLRAAGGHTRRANSVLPDGDDGSLPFDTRIGEAEAFYRRQGLPPRFQVSPAVEPPDLDAVLERRGYRAEAPTSVQLAPLAEVLERAGDLSDREAGTLTVDPTLGADWFDTWYGVSGREADRELARRVLASIGPAAGHALLLRDGLPVATGRAVAERGWAGLFAMATVPAARRSGAGWAILGGLARWSETAGARRLYLQVELGNLAATALYRRAGFRHAYTYHYRVAPKARGGERE
jgi:GNAT superfamily N-acetyltransferase